MRRANSIKQAIRWSENAEKSGISPVRRGTVRLCQRTRLDLPATFLRVLVAVRFGVIAQLVERLNGIEEVWGSNPHGSTLPVTRVYYCTQRPLDSPGNQLLRYITE